MEQQRLFSTPEASQETGIPEGTIRSWMSRYPGVFEENKHYVIETSGRKLWTEQGVELLRSRKNNPLEAIENATSNTANSDAEAGFNVDALVEPLLDKVAGALAVRFWEKLPERTLAQIQRMIVNPTPEEAVLVQQSVSQALALGTSKVLSLSASEPRRLAG